MSNLVVSDHPFILERLALLREKTTSTAVFRKTMSECGALLSYEICQHFPTISKRIETPLEKAEAIVLQYPIVVIGILRAALGLVDGLITFIPDAKVGHLGFYRDEATLQPVEYYSKLPSNLDKAQIILADSMLATGGSMLAALDMLQKHDCLKSTFVATLIAAPEGVKAVHAKYPNIKIFTAALDRELNEKGYILPGLGDAGDRQYGTF